jgi:hypothetical protein
MDFREALKKTFAFDDKLCKMPLGSNERHVRTRLGYQRRGDNVKRIIGIAIFLVFVAIAAQAARHQTYIKINLSKISYGMTTDELRRAIGRPERINTYASPNGETQQWIYPQGPDSDLYIYFENGVFYSYQYFNTGR